MVPLEYLVQYMEVNTTVKSLLMAHPHDLSQESLSLSRDLQCAWCMSAGGGAGIFNAMPSPNDTIPASSSFSGVIFDTSAPGDDQTSPEASASGDAGFFPGQASVLSHLPF